MTTILEDLNSKLHAYMYIKQCVVDSIEADKYPQVDS